MEKQYDLALRWAVPLSDGEATRPLALFVLGGALGGTGNEASAARAFGAAARHAIAAGNAALAIAACKEIGAHGGDQTSIAHEIAEAFARGSPRLMAEGAPKPPQLPTQAQPVQELKSMSRAELVKRATKVIDDVEAQPRGTAKLPSHVLLSELEQPSLAAMIPILEVQFVASGERLIEQGSTGGAEAFIVARGELDVLRDAGASELKLARLGIGSLIGEMALLSRAPRAASVVACRPSIVLVARKDALERVARERPEIAKVIATLSRRRMIDNLLRTSSMLSAVDPKERRSLVHQFVTRTFEAGDRLIEQGKDSDGLHLIASGEVSVVRRETDEDIVITKLGAGEVVGEVALVLRRPSNADVIASHPTVTLHLARAGFLDVIRRHPTLLAQLYELAVKRDEETTTILAQESASADDAVLI
jgi:cAMP-dependent protein kinase regulator